MNKIILGIVVVLVVLGGWFFMSSGSDNEEVKVEEKLELNDTQPVDPKGAVGAQEEEKGGVQENMSVLELNVEDSEVAWAASKIVGSSHTGTVSFTSGTMSHEDGVVTAANFVADMTSIVDDGGSARLEQHLKSDDFFAAEQFPTVEFTLTSATETEWTGDMTIRGQAQEVTFPVSANITEAGAEVTAEFTIDRTRWGVNFDSGSIFQTLGDKAIKDEVGLNVSLTLK